MLYIRYNHIYNYYYYIFLENIWNISEYYEGLTPWNCIKLNYRIL